VGARCANRPAQGRPAPDPGSHVANRCRDRWRHRYRTGRRRAPHDRAGSDGVRHYGRPLRRDGRHHSRRAVRPRSHHQRSRRRLDLEPRAGGRRFGRGPRRHARGRWGHLRRVGRCRDRRRSYGCRHCCGRGRRLHDGRRGRRRCRRPRRQQPERVDVAVGLGGDPDAEMDRRAGVRGGSADRVALSHRRTLCDADRAELREGDGVAVGGRDRHGLAVGGNAARERDNAGGRRSDRGGGRAGDGDTAALAAGVRMCGIEGERLEHGALDGPRPGACRRCEDRREDHCKNRRAHAAPPPCCPM
jgi:hypothetical protein